MQMKEINNVRSTRPRRAWYVYGSPRLCDFRCWLSGGVLALLFPVLTACTTPVPVNRPCGVITDSLKDVKGATPADDQRIDVHHARGKAAKCWQ